ncbi:MAG: flagellar protein FliT [Zhongshania sp.]|uniref:flagellar protein FliT n=1 Tax=Zhongshania sp. TaxID=1971902 RepID=UPI002636C8A4|nr:flagellar protein FliT [Zhongshania sp.]MDF1690904.1 flagellar protein FliT [Zhongshania sp.]
MNIDMLRNSEVLGARQRQLRDILLISESIQELANNNDWAEAVAQQTRRRALMDVFFSQECSPSESQQVAEVIEAILVIDQNVADVLYRQRSAMLTDANQSRQNVRNVDAYLTHSLA